MMVLAIIILLFLLFLIGLFLLSNEIEPIVGIVLWLAALVVVYWLGNSITTPADYYEDEEVEFYVLKTYEDKPLSYYMDSDGVLINVNRFFGVNVYDTMKVYRATPKAGWYKGIYWEAAWSGYKWKLTNAQGEIICER